MKRKAGRLLCVPIEKKIDEGTKKKKAFWMVSGDLGEGQPPGLREEKKPQWSIERHATGAPLHNQGGGSKKNYEGKAREKEQA